jgi:hypothetical protein
MGIFRKKSDSLKYVQEIVNLAQNSRAFIESGHFRTARNVLGKMVQLDLSSEAKIHREAWSPTLISECEEVKGIAEQISGELRFGSDLSEAILAIDRIIYLRSELLINFAIANRKRKILYLKGILIPNAFTPWPESLDQEAKDYFEFNGGVLRDYGNKSFIFDKKDQEFNAFLARCNGHSRLVNSLVHTICQKRNLKVWAKNKTLPKKYNLYKKISFSIRPLFFDSKVEQEGTKKEWHTKNYEFMLHFDELHTFDSTRSKMTFGDPKGNELKLKLSLAIDEYKKELESLYGDWDNFAIELVNILEDTLNSLYSTKKVYDLRRNRRKV